MAQYKAYFTDKDQAWEFAKAKVKEGMEVTDYGIYGKLFFIEYKEA